MTCSPVSLSILLTTFLYLCQFLLIVSAAAAVSPATLTTQRIRRLRFVATPSGRNDSPVERTTSSRQRALSLALSRRRISGTIRKTVP